MGAARGGQRSKRARMVNKTVFAGAQRRTSVLVASVQAHVRSCWTSTENNNSKGLRVEATTGGSAARPVASHHVGYDHVSGPVMAMSNEQTPATVAAPARQSRQLDLEGVRYKGRMRYGAVFLSCDCVRYRVAVQSQIQPMENWREKETKLHRMYRQQLGVLWVSPFQATRLQRSESSGKPANTQAGCSADTDFYQATSHPVANLHPAWYIYPVLICGMSLMPPVKLSNNSRSTTPLPLLVLAVLFACLRALRCIHRQK